MANLFMQGGALMWPIALIAVVVVGLAARTGVELVARGGRDAARIQNGLDGLLFWGGFATIAGCLGTVTGYHKSMAAVVAYGVINPRAVWVGMAQGLVSTIAGLLVLVVAGLCWFVLRWRFQRRRLSR